VNDNPRWVHDGNAAALTDLYQLTMLQAYVEEGLDAESTFDLFVRTMPRTRNFLLACGLDDALRYLESVSFSQDVLEYLESQGQFSSRFLSWLEGFRFEGEVFAVPEGTPVFAEEPILEVVAPLPQAQLVESYLLNQVTFQTVLASKGARVAQASAGRLVVDFGMRRVHGTDAAMKAARAFYVAGIDATSNVLAGKVFGIPISGTVAHSYIEAHEDELDAFRCFTRIYPDTVLLVDTYDTLEGVQNVTRLAEELGDDFKVHAIRLDSGDLAQLARDARAILDQAGLEAVGIFASGGLEEERIAQLVRSGAPIDGFGVGTKLGVSVDCPMVDSVYKMAAYAGEGRMKLSAGKATWPGRKQVFRVCQDGETVRDILGLHDEPVEGTPLLRKVMEGGERLPAGQEDLELTRARAAREIGRLPERLRGLERADPPFEVHVSSGLLAERDRIRARLEARVPGE
jgi:nicotinate phosphoribosyltransferase